MCCKKLDDMFAAKQIVFPFSLCFQATVVLNKSRGTTTGAHKKSS